MVEQKEEKAEESKGEKEDFESKWDTARQEKEQAEANYTKAVAEKEAVSEQLNSNRERIAELEAQIAAKKEDTPYPEIDPELTDGNVIKSITQMRAELKAYKEKTNSLEEVAETYKTKEAQRETQAYQDRLIEKMCKPLDDEFGVKHRNPARNLADRLVDEGKEKKPEDPIDAMILMRKCYTQVSKKTDSGKDDSVRTDSGRGGASAPADKVKVGTNDEVFADMRKNKSSWINEPVKEVF